MSVTELLFTIANTAILLVWLPLLVRPKARLTQVLIRFPYVPLVLSFFYLFFLIKDNALSAADFSSLDGIVALFRNATPEGAAAGWMHYLAFDFWVGCWMVRDAQKKEIPHLWIVFPLLFTFMMGPVGILLYVAINLIFNPHKS
ncbi:MAG: ABA4-like family protein [Flavobacteriaceae bacterium]